MLTSHDFSAEFERATYRRVTWRLLPFLFLCYILAYLDRVNVGFAKLQMQQDLGLSDSAYGLGAGIFFIGYFLFEVPSNLIMQRVGARFWIARIMIVWGMLSAGMMFTKSETAFLTLRFLLGVAEAGFFPGIILYLTYWYPGTHRAKMVAAFMTAIALSGVLGGPVSGWILAQMAGVADLAGWRWLFLIEGVPTVIVGLWAIFYLDDQPGKAAWLEVRQRELLLLRLAEEEQRKRLAGASHHTLRQAFRSPRVWLLCLIYFGVIMGNYGIGFWLPQIIKDTITTDVWSIGLISMIPWGVAAAFMVWNGHHSDRTGERRWHIALPGLTGAAAFALSGLPGLSTGPVALALLTVATTGVMAALSAFWVLPTALLSGTAAAAGIAWINSVGNLGGYVSPYLIGRMRDATGSMVPGLMLLAVSCVMSALLVLCLTRRGTRT